MTDEVTFYDPHDGISGCTAPLPDHIKTTADWLDGQSMTLDEAKVVFMDAVSDMGLEEATVTVHDDDSDILKAITLKVGNFKSPPVFCWRLIRFRHNIKETV